MVRPAGELFNFAYCLWLAVCNLFHSTFNTAAWQAVIYQYLAALGHLFSRTEVPAIFLRSDSSFLITAAGVCLF